MKLHGKVINKTPLIISIGMVLGLSMVDVFAETNPLPTVSTAPVGQAVVKTKVLKKTKKPQKSKSADGTVTGNNTNITPSETKTETPKVVKQSQQATEEKKAQAEETKVSKPNELSTVKVVSGRSRSLLGLTNSASQGIISQEQIEFRSIARNGELMELIPGMIATQHSGSGKANQYFLRGYNLDHGTDFTTVVDGIPMNMPTHAHGQGYMDLNSMIPELVDKIEFGKGPYYAEIGDFSVAGYNKMTTMKSMPQGIFKFTGGEFDFYRTMAANSNKIGDGNLFYAAEFQTYNGAWAVPENGHKYNGLLRYSLDQDNWGVAVNAKAYTNTWTATNQIPQSAVDSGTLGLYGSMTPSDGGNTNRYTFSTNLWNKGKDWKNDANLYAVYYDFSMFSNFTGYLNGPLGDQIHQTERRVQIGGNEDFVHYDNLFGFDMDNSVGFSFRHDQINGLGIAQTVNRQYLNQISLDNVEETTAGFYLKNQIHWHEKLKTTHALRADFISNDVTALANGYTDPSNLLTGGLTASQIAQNALTSAQINAANSGSAAKAMLSPKFGLVLGPWYDTEYFANFGYGYHSNDARGTVLSSDPNYQTPQIGGSGYTGYAGYDALSASLKPILPMAWSRGGEIGSRSNFIPKLNSTLALWWLESSQELVFSGDSGTTNVNGSSYRYGLEFTNYYKVNDWLTLDFDLAKTNGYFAQTPQTNSAGGCDTANGNPGNPCTGNHIPNMVGTVIAAGIQVVAPNGMFGSLRLRHFGDSPLDSNGSLWAPDVNILNLGLGYKQKTYKLDFSIFNLLGQETSDIAYAYNYAYPNNTTNINNPQYGVVKHPVEPRMARAGFTIYF